jgi:hypothetical protein
MIFRVLQVACCHTEKVASDHRIAFGNQFETLPSYQADGGVDDRLSRNPVRTAVFESEDVAIRSKPRWTFR